MKNIEQLARDEGMEALAMPVVTRTEGTVYAVEDTSRLRWYKLSDGRLRFDIRKEHRLLDVEPQSAYTAIQNQIDALQANQAAILAAAFKTGPEVTLEHLEAVQAAGDRAVERLTVTSEITRSAGSLSA